MGGAAHAVAVASLDERRVARAGLATGLAAWTVSLVELPALGLAPPVWKYPRGEIAADASDHAVYGWATAAGYRLLSEHAWVGRPRVYRTTRW